MLAINIKLLPQETLNTSNLQLIQLVFNTVNFRDNFVNCVDRHICHVKKKSQLGHDLQSTYIIKRQGDFAILCGFYFPKTLENKTLTKISEFTVYGLFNLCCRQFAMVS